MVDEKRIDENWKEKIKEEKKKSEQASKYLEANFGTFISSLIIQALIFLGEMENPTTKKTETNLAQASFLIDTLGMLKEKTRGNLSKDEIELLDNALYDLRMRYVNKVK